MSTSRTTVCELGTALGMLGHDDPRPVERPVELVNVTTDKWEDFASTVGRGVHRSEFERSFANGRAFLLARDGLRGRLPVRVEWKGDHRPVGTESIPTDLRVDHVYLISCKDGSRILYNPSPVSLFDGIPGGGPPGASDWYGRADPIAYQALYAAVRDVVGVSLPPNVADLQPADRERLKAALGARTWPATLIDPYRAFCRAIERATVERWSSQLVTRQQQEAMYWRLVRVTVAPYFLLGFVGGEDIRVRVGAHWDWRQSFEFLALRVGASGLDGQPTVRWRAEIRERSTGDVREVCGHVEVRWSKGRFRQAPEAKVVLDSRHRDVAGYFPIE